MMVTSGNGISRKFRLAAAALSLAAALGAVSATPALADWHGGGWHGDGGGWHGDGGGWRGGGDGWRGDGRPYGWAGGYGGPAYWGGYPPGYAYPPPPPPPVVAYPPPYGYGGWYGGDDDDD